MIATVGGVFPPRSAAELIQALESGALPHEAAAFDVKAQLPERNKRGDIAVDVAAMATDGGVLIYGVLENKEAGTFSPSPIELAGVQELISEVVMANVRERIEFAVTPLPLDDDSAKGFVLVDVPASLRAPHMVERRGEYRFYGRGPAGNVPLTEAQVAAHYLKRGLAEDEASKAMDVAIAAMPSYDVIDGERRGNLIAVIKPLISDRNLRERVWATEDLGVAITALQGADRALQFRNNRGLRLADMIQGLTVRTTPDGLCVENPPFPRAGGGEMVTSHVQRLDVLDEGTLRYFRTRVARKMEVPHVSGFLLQEGAVGQLIATLCVLAGWLFNRGGYYGAVDVSVALTGIEGAASWEWLGAQIPPPPGATNLIDQNEYRDHVRVLMPQLATEPSDIAARLLDRLYRTIRRPNFVDPLELEIPPAVPE